MRRATHKRRPKPKPRVSPDINSRIGKYIKLLIIFSVYLIAFLFLAFVVPMRPMQEKLSLLYDDLARADFESAVIDGSDPNPISSDLKLVLFGKSDYEQSYTNGYWTPRDDLGLAVLNTVKRDAKMVVVNFSFDREAPIVIKDGQPFDGNQKFIEHLTEAGELARMKKTTIIMPTISSESSSPKGYQKLLCQYNDVFQQVNIQGILDEHDDVMRYFTFFRNGQNGVPPLQELNPTLKGPTISSHLIYRILPREVLKDEFDYAPNILKDVVWHPGQIASVNMAEPDFCGKVVLIGSDYHENGDYHQTVFGPLSGSYILANGINMILTGRIVEDSKKLNNGIWVIMGILISFLYACFPSLKHTYILLVMMSVGTLFSSTWIFKHYEFFRYVFFPIFAIGSIHSIFGELRCLVVLVRKIPLKKWLRNRKFLK